MSGAKNKKQDKKTEELRDEAKIGDKLPGRNTSEKADIEQTRIENRRGPISKTKRPEETEDLRTTMNDKQTIQSGRVTISFVMSSPGYQVLLPH